MLDPARLHVPRSLARTRRRAPAGSRADTAFDRVIRACAEIQRPDQEGTWITPAMVRAYRQLHALGFAHSFEAWEGEALVGGLYGVSLGAAFFGESMFAVRPDASKLAFVESVEWLAARGVRLIDCQVRTEHLARFGAEDWPRERFLAALAEALERPDAARAVVAGGHPDVSPSSAAMADPGASDPRLPPKPRNQLAPDWEYLAPVPFRDLSL